MRCSLPMKQFNFDTPPRYSCDPITTKTSLTYTVIMSITHLKQELKEILQSPTCIGFVGGRVSHAIYFVGHRTTASGSTELLGLDPHR
jgi:hypothetical protein